MKITSRPRSAPSASAWSATARRWRTGIYRRRVRGPGDRHDPGAPRPKGRAPPPRQHGWSPNALQVNPRKPRLPRPDPLERQALRRPTRAIDREGHLRAGPADPRPTLQGRHAAARQPHALPALRARALPALRTRLRRHLRPRPQRPLHLLRLLHSLQVRPRPLPRTTTVQGTPGARRTHPARHHLPRRATHQRRTHPSRRTGQHRPSPARATTRRRARRHPKPRTQDRPLPTSVRGRKARPRHLPAAHRAPPRTPTSPARPGGPARPNTRRTRRHTARHGKPGRDRDQLIATANPEQAKELLRLLIKDIRVHDQHKIIPTTTVSRQRFAQCTEQWAQLLGAQTIC